MHCNQALTARLNFQKNSKLSQDERLTFLFENRNESNSASSASTTIPWPKSLSTTKRLNNLVAWELSRRVVLYYRSSMSPNNMFQFFRHRNIELLSNVEAQFNGPSDNDSEAASVHSEDPIPNQETFW